MKIKPFLLGAAGYPCLEMLYRRRTHPAMSLAGGICCAVLCRIARSSGPLAVRAFRGACAVTGIEYAAGLIFNRRHRIWDYRAQTGHVRGQVCPQFFGVWYLLSLGLMAVHDKMKR